MNKKIVPLFAILLAFAMMFSACDSGNGGNTKKEENEKLQKASAVEIGDYLLRNLKFEDALTKVDDDLFRELYLIEKGAFEDGALYVSTYTSEEIAIIKLKEANSEELKKFKKIFEDRIEIQKMAFGVYRPEEVGKLDEALIYCKGNTAIMVVSGDKKTAKATIENFGKDEE